MDNRISAIGVADYDLEALISAVEGHFQALEVWGDLRPGMRVTLKPNLLRKDAPEGAVTTHPTVVEAVARVLQAHGIRDITLADSPGGPYTGALLQAIYAGCGMTEMAQRCGIRLNTGVGSRSAASPGAQLCRTFDLIDPVAGADFVINLPKLKTHAMTTLSCGVKNLFGCVPGLQKPELHFRFPQKEQFSRMLVDLSLLVRPGLTLVDGVVGMEGDGPSGGVPRRLGYTFAARNVHTLDLGLCPLLGMPVESVWTVAHAVASGLCPPTPEEVAWLGEGMPPPFRNFKLPRSRPLSFGNRAPRFLRKPLEWAEEHLLAPRPVVISSRCIGCGKCRESCAPRAMAIRQGKAELDYSKCIRCYCCQEMCPVKAVKIRRVGLLKF